MVTDLRNQVALIVTTVEGKKKRGKPALFTS